MIFIYQLLYGILGIFMLWSVFRKEGLYEKIAMAVLAIPFILRALQIK